MKIFKKITGVLLLLAGALLVAFVFGNVPTKPITDLISPKISYDEILEGYDLDFVGKIGADDVPVLTSAELTSNEIRDSYTFVLETDNIISLDYYKLRNSDWTQIGGNSYNTRGRGLKLPNETENPIFFANFLYAGYYLVELDDGSYIAAFMNSDYANSKTLPIAYLDRMSSDVEEDITSLIDENTDIELQNVNLENILIMQADESDVGGDFLDLTVRIIISAVLAVVLFIGVVVLNKKMKLF